MKMAFRRRAIMATWPKRMLAIARCSMIALALTVAGAASAQARSLPDGVPDLFNPDAKGEWQAYQAGNLDGNADFPVVIVVNTAGKQPAAVLMAVDAQNGSDHWSLASDPIVVIALFSDPHTITRVYADSGFSQSGTPSGSYTDVANPSPDTLAGLLQSLPQASRGQQPGDEQAQRPNDHTPGAQPAPPSAGQPKKTPEHRGQVVQQIEYRYQ